MPNVIWWVIHIVIAVLIFFVVQWLLPKLAELIRVPIPDNIVAIIALLLALLYLAGGWYGNWWRRPVSPP
jgi:putative effector of murein hydrolase LrgA (UPF0299 family)